MKTNKPFLEAVLFVPNRCLVTKLFPPSKSTSGETKKTSKGSLRNFELLFYH
jgi:hypothetical protein